MVLSEYVMELAEKEAKRRLAPKLDDLVSLIADEIYETVLECEWA
jgi:hypothetical protein